MGVEYLAAVLGRPVASRTANGTLVRPAMSQTYLATTTFIATRDVVLLGPGTGRTYLGIALRDQGRRGLLPRGVRLRDQITRLIAVHARSSLERELRKLDQYRLLVIEEVGYLPCDTAAAALFLQLIGSRYESGSVVVTSKLAFSHWRETLGDDGVGEATIDGLGRHRWRQRRRPPETTRTARGGQRPLSRRGSSLGRR